MLEKLSKIVSTQAGEGSFDSARLPPCCAHDHRSERLLAAGDWRLATDPLPPNQTCQSRSKNSESKISPASPPRGQINFHGQACQCRSMVVHGHDAARVRWPDHGVQCFRRDGQGTFWFALQLRPEAIVLGTGRHVGHGVGHEDRLSPVQASGRGFFVAGRHHVAAALRVPARPLAQYPSLDPLERFLLRALRTRQAGADFVSRIFPRGPNQVD